MRDIVECNQIIEEFLNQYYTKAIGYRIKNWRDNTFDSDIEELNEICNEIEDFLY